MSTFKSDGVIDANEMRAVAAFINIAGQHFSEQRDSVSEFARSVLKDVYEEAQTGKFSNAVKNLDDREMQKAHEVFTTMYASFEAKPDNWFQKHGMNKGPDLAILQNLIADIEAGVLAGKLSFTAFPAELRKPASDAAAVKTLLSQHGLNAEKPIEEVFHGKVYDIHTGKNNKLVVIYAEFHGERGINEDIGASLMEVGYKLLFHEMAPFYEELDVATMSQHRMCEALQYHTQFSRPFMKVKCARPQTRVIGMSREQQHREYRGWLQQVDGGNPTVPLLRMHESHGKRSLVYAKHIAEGFKNEQVAAVSLGKNHLSLVLSALKESGFSYIVVMPKTYDSKRQ
jgi:hypothetical protein